MKTIYYNGVVYTGQMPLVSAFAVENEKFIFTGNDKDAKALAEGEDKLVDLAGDFVVSGFNDSHMHLLGLGNALSVAPLASHTNSLKELLDCFREFKDSHTFGENTWLLGRGWNQDYFTDVKRLPNRHDLDQVSRAIPICAVRACGHCLVVNSKALELLGVTGETPSPDGGRIGLEEDGTPDGRFYDIAMDYVYDRIPVPDKDTLKSMILAACKMLNAYGVTSSQSDDYCAFTNVPWTLVNEAYQELEQEGKLTVRVYQQSNFTTLQDLQAFVQAGNNTGTGTNLYKIGPLKMLGDGALGPRTAYLSRPYADDDSTNGIPVFSQETLDEMIAYANEQGMQAAVHAIGDACLDRVLAAFEKALKKHPRKDHRHGIVHCQITRPDQLVKICELKLHVYAQSIFLDYDIQMVEQRVGKELAATSYSWKTLMKRGVTVSNGTDCPVELPAALACIQCAVTRKTLKAQAGPYLPAEAFTVQEALDSYTLAGAQASFEEAYKGQIAPGMLADFVVLGQNPFTINPAFIKDIPVRATYLGGKAVYQV